MRPSLLSALALLWLAELPAHAAASNVLVYYENDGGLSSAALRARSQFFNQLASDTYSVDAQGIVTGVTFKADLTVAHYRRILTFATVSNFGDSGLSAPIAHSIFISPARVQRFILYVQRILASGGYRGFNFDFESVPSTDRVAFTHFVATLSASLHRSGYLLIVSVPAELHDAPTDSWSGAFDFPALAPLVDTLQLMCYDENGTWSTPGPVAGLDWVQSCVTYAASVVPSRKISLGIPAYGYDWDLTNSTANTQIPWTAIAPLLAQSSATAQWDTATSSPYFNYTLNNHQHIVWYENSLSITLKGQLAISRALNGVSVYALGMEDPSFWQSLHAGL